MTLLCEKPAWISYKLTKIDNPRKNVAKLRKLSRFELNISSPFCVFEETLFQQEEEKYY